MTEPIKLPPFDWHYLVDQSGVEDYARLAVEQATADLRAELADIRAELAGGDAAALPNDYTTTQMARTIRTERDKFMWQVRDTCTRAEKAEAERDEAIRDHDAVLERFQGEIQCLTEERDEARAELARLTTLRPASEHANTGLALWHFASGAATVSRKAQVGSVGWTPLPDVKEAKP
jgi:chromosome segregation ATPase